jgi:hypothetical protein
MTALPGAAIMLTVLALSLLGDALNTALPSLLASVGQGWPDTAPWRAIFIFH